MRNRLTNRRRSLIIRACKQPHPMGVDMALSLASIISVEGRRTVWRVLLNEPPFPLLAEGFASSVDEGKRLAAEWREAHGTVDSMP
jgi:hypothetical protein